MAAPDDGGDAPKSTIQVFTPASQLAETTVIVFFKNNISGATSETWPASITDRPYGRRTANDCSGLYNPLSSFQVLAAAKLVM